MAKKGKCSKCMQTVYWKQKEDGSWLPPFADKGLTLKHSCSGRHVNAKTNKAVISTIEGTESIEKAHRFLSMLNVKKSLKEAYKSKNLEVDGWDVFWNDVQDARRILRKCHEYLS